MNIDTTPDWLATMATQALRLDPPPTEDEINQVLGRLASAFSIDPATLAEALRMLHARFSIRMEMGQTIQDEHVPWLDARRSKIDPFYWNRYNQLLLRNGWSPRVAGTLDRSMDELLDLLGNPADERTTEAENTDRGRSAGWETKWSSLYVARHRFQENNSDGTQYLAGGRSRAGPGGHQKEQSSS